MMTTLLILLALIVLTGILAWLVNKNKDDEDNDNDVPKCSDIININ